MLPVSSRWAAAISANHTPIYKAELWRTGTKLIDGLRLENATVTKDAGAYPRTSGSVTVADTSPSVAKLATPFGNRLRLYRGVRYPEALVPPDLPLIADLDIVASRFSRPAGTLELELADPAAAVAGQQRMGLAVSSPAVTSVRDGIAWLIGQSRFYGDKNLIDLTTAAQQAVPMPSPYVIDGDPWQAIEQLADSIGCECWFAPDRTPVLRPVPVLKGTADATLYARDGGVVTLIDSALIRTANVVKIRGGPEDDSGKTIIGFAADTDPASPTYVNGPYGLVVLIEERPAPFRTQANANAAAAALLERAQAGVRTVTLECVPNPAIEPGDTVQIRFAGGVLERQVVVRVDIPFGPADVMRVATRSTAYTAAGWP